MIKPKELFRYNHVLRKNGLLLMRGGKCVLKEVRRGDPEWDNARYSVTLFSNPKSENILMAK